MITAGIDVGLKYVKAVILKDGTVVGRARSRSGGAERAANAEAAYGDALKDAGIAAGDVSKVVSTGIGKHDVPFAGARRAESVAAVQAARFLCPEATTVVDIGADETLVSTIKDDGTPGEFTINQKCAAGLGLFLDYMADRLELSIEEASAAAPANNHCVSDGCVTFAELDALSLLNRGAAPAEIAGAVTLSAAARAASTINDITVPDRRYVVLCGGLNQNKAFVKALETLTEIAFHIPENADYAGAIGAAVIAAS
jgi:predicted CoA-substrate-specific enzyme activase